MKLKKDTNGAVKRKFKSQKLKSKNWDVEIVKVIFENVTRKWKWNVGLKVIHGSENGKLKLKVVFENETRRRNSKVGAESGFCKCNSEAKLEIYVWKLN